MPAWQPVQNGTDDHEFDPLVETARGIGAIVEQTCDLKALTVTFVAESNQVPLLLSAKGVCSTQDDPSLTSETRHAAADGQSGARELRPQSAPLRGFVQQPAASTQVAAGRIRPQSAVERPLTGRELGSMYKESMATLANQKTTQTHRHVARDRSSMDATGRPLSAQEKHEFMSDFLERIASTEHTLLRTSQRPASKEAVRPTDDEEMVASLTDMTSAAWSLRREAALECLREEQMKLFAVTIRADAAVKRLFSIIGLLCDDRTMNWQTAMKHLKQPTAFLEKLRSVQPGKQEKRCIVAALELVGDLKAWNPDILCAFGPTAGHLAHWAIVTAFESGFVTGLPVPEALR